MIRLATSSEQHAFDAGRTAALVGEGLQANTYHNVGHRLAFIRGWHVGCQELAAHAILAMRGSRVAPKRKSWLARNWVALFWGTYLFFVLLGGVCVV